MRRYLLLYTIKHKDGHEQHWSMHDTYKDAQYKLGMEVGRLCKEKRGRKITQSAILKVKDAQMESGT